MKKFLLPLCSVMALSVTFSSCKKDKKEDPAPTKTKTELLTQSGRKWKISAQTLETKVGSAAATSQNLLLGARACELDDYFVFNTNQTLTYNVATKCDATDPTEVNSTGVWLFNAGQTELTATAGNGVDISGTLLQLDAAMLKTQDIYRDTASSGTITVRTTTTTLGAF